VTLTLRIGAATLVSLLLAGSGCRDDKTVGVPTGDSSGPCAIAPASLGFGSVTVSSYKDLTFTIANTGDADLGGEISGTDEPFVITQGEGAFSLSPGESLSVTVRYAPAAVGSHTGVIETGDEACADVPCAGSAVSGVSQGYTLFSPNNSRQTYLLDMSKTVVHTWTHDRAGGYSAYLLEDGSVLRTAIVGSSVMDGGGAQGMVQKVGPDGVVLWEYTYSDNSHRSHHDIEPMPNGNILLIAWERKTAAQASDAGLAHDVEIWPDHLIEVQPAGSGGTIVWEWHAWDHLVQDHDASKSNYGVVGEHPELLDINMGGGGGLGGGDWMHLNAISYRPDWDQILVSSHELDEIYVIDHSTTTAEAAGHQGGRSGKGGDILYRWGCPANYDAPGARYFNVVHCSTWIPSGLPGAGNILAFNNRENQGTSIVAELTPPVDARGNYILESGSAYGPAAPVWSYTSSGFYSNHLGGCQRLLDGNTLIIESLEGRIFEVDASGAVTWSYARGGEIARALRYTFGYPGLTALGLGVAKR
jgi:hypothetical protein